MERKPIDEVKEALNNLLDYVEKLAEDFSDGPKIVEQLKDLDASEGVELAMAVMLRLPKIIDKFKK